MEEALTPQWSPDGTRIAFSGPGEKPPVKLFVKEVGSLESAPTPVGASDRPNFASGWSGNSLGIVSVRTDAVRRDNLWLHRLQDNVDERLALDTEFNESHGRVSPDNRWIAYQTDASGRREVWMASFPPGRSGARYRSEAVRHPNGVTAARRLSTSRTTGG